MAVVGVTELLSRECMDRLKEGITGESPYLKQGER
jgi:hypothetical protein